MYLLKIWDSENECVSYSGIKLEQKAERNYVEDGEEISFVSLGSGVKSVVVGGREIGVIRPVEVVN